MVDGEVSDGLVRELVAVRHEVADALTAIALLSGLIDSGLERLDGAHRASLATSLNARVRYHAEDLMPAINDVFDRIQQRLGAAERG